MHELVDGDWAANYGGWQWVAGTAPDPNGNFRIFNPVAQQRRYDPALTYCRRWIAGIGHARLPEADGQSRAGIGGVRAALPEGAGAAPRAAALNRVKMGRGRACPCPSGSQETLMDPKSLKLFYEPKDRLRLTVGDEKSYHTVKPAWAAPLSRPWSISGLSGRQRQRNCHAR